VNYFGVYNLGEVLEPETVAKIVGEFPDRLPSAGDIVADLDGNRGVAGVVDSLKRHLPALGKVPEMSWLTERLDGLYRILPEAVVQAGGMGKAIRATAGVLAIGAYDTLDAPMALRREHLAKILPGAYALGAAYVIVDDTLQDLPGEYISAADREWCHQSIIHGLSTGDCLDVAEMPDHPLAEELHGLYGLLLESHPFAEYRHLYHAAEAMYLAQHRDSSRTVEEVTAGGIAMMYPDILVKSGMSRVVANILGRRRLGEQFYPRCINTIVLGQFKDDLRDREEDLRANRLTPFTVPSGTTDTNPLYDLFAYDAYVAAEVFGGDPGSAEDLMRRYEITSEIGRYLRAASGLRSHVIKQLEPVDTRIKDQCGVALRHRKQTMVDSRTFVADRLPRINDIARRCYPQGAVTGLSRIVAYAMEAPGKRLRPALGLMLAEGLGVDLAAIDPFVAACELFHTASLLFDDLPAQDNASVRRGRPTAHTVFDEGSVQLAAVSMISLGFGMLTRLDQHYPAEKVTEVIAYVGTVLGPERLCRGQDLDLHMGRVGVTVTGEEILEMYDLKTSTPIEAALVPLMMLEGRPGAEIELVRQYAHHAGIVFQIRDDILDLTSSTESLGKDTGNDVGKVNIVRAYGLAEAQRLLRAHLEDAVACCSRLPFDTYLLKGMVTHFADRRR
jgi:geranylgeranyl pyrophosphate synthase